LGPIVIHGPSSADWDYDLGTLIVGDWYNRSQFILLDEFFASGPPAAASTVFNGQGVRNTNGTLTGHYYDITRKMKFKPGARYLLRIINAAVDAKYELSLDGHKMEVISLDWTPIKPYKTRTAFLANGQRMQVVIRAKGSPGKSYWFRADTTALAMDRGTTCGDRNLSANQSRAIIRYIGADHSAPTSKPHLYTPHCSDESLKGASPVVPLRLRAPKSTQTITINPLQANASGDLVFRVDNSSLYLNFNKPTLNLINDGFSRFPPSYNVYFLEGHSEDTALIVLQDQTGIPHPVHLHGHDISIASLGAGPWNGTLKFNNPARRDTVQMESNGHLAMHFAMDNPGAWLWHCHIAFHVSAGFGAQFVERLKDINIESNVTQTYKTCSQWDAWTKFNLVLQFDSGV
jgi:FtsP/CotA-like multicopper oxidase with cupredoxin domain